MKIQITFKHADAVDIGIDEAIAKEGLLEALSEDDSEANYFLEASIKDEVKRDLSKWVSYGEYITVDFDTEAGTAIVKENVA